MESIASADGTKLSRPANEEEEMDPREGGQKCGWKDGSEVTPFVTIGLELKRGERESQAWDEQILPDRVGAPWAGQEQISTRGCWTRKWKARYQDG